MSVRIKGQSFVGFLATLRKLYGEPAHARVIAALHPDLGAALRSGEIVPMGWYSLEWYTSLHRAARSVCGDRVSREVGREAARSDLNSIYRFVLKFMSPETLLNQSAKVFGLFCEGGKCTVAAVRKGSARIRYTECPGACRGMWELVLGTTELMIELCGGKNVKGTAVSGGGDGDSNLVAEFTWTGG
jgi:hypothetical protein